MCDLTKPSSIIEFSHVLRLLHRSEKKLMSSILFVNRYGENENLGTDFYTPDLKVAKTLPYKNNTGYIFTSEKNSWHGLEKKKIKKERRCLQLNYVTFETEWPVD